MATSATAVESAKRIAHLGAQRDKLEEETIILKEEVMTAKASEELMKEKYLKVKSKLEKAKEMFESEKSKWREEEDIIWEKCSKAESEKLKLEIDLRAAAAWRRTEDGGDYAVRSLVTFDAENEGLKCLLEERDCTIGTLLGKNEVMEAAIVKVEEKNFELFHKIEALEKEKVDKDAEIRKLQMDKSVEDEGIVNANNALEVLKKEINGLAERNAALEAVKEAGACERTAMEEEHKKKVLELTRSIDVLEREKREVEDKLVQANRDYKEEIRRISCEKMAAEAEKRAMEVENEKVVSEQARRIEVLEWEIKESEAAVSREKKEKSEEIERILKAKADLKEKLEKKNLDLDLRVDVLEREKKDLEDDAGWAMKAVLKEKNDKNEEIKRILNEKAVMKEECDKKILKFVSRVHILGREKMEAKAEACEAKKHDRTEEINRILSEKAEVEKNVLELLQKIKALEEEGVSKDDEIHRLKMDKSIEAERILNANNALEVQKKEMGKARETINGLVERVAILEAAKEAGEYEKLAMEDEQKKKVLELTKSIEVLEGKKREWEAKHIQESRDSREEIKRISCEKMVVEAEKRAMKDKGEKEILEHARRIEVLEWENREMQAEVSQAKREKIEEIKRIFNEMEAMKEKHEKKHLELVSTVDELEREKKEMEAEADRSKSADLKEKHEKNDEIKRIVNEKAALKEKCDRKISKFVPRIHILEREKKEAEAEACRAKTATSKENHDKIEEMRVTLKEQYDKKILDFFTRVDVLNEKNSDLFSRVNILEREKRELEIETKKKEGVIKLLKQQNACLAANKEIMEMETNRCVVLKLEEDVESLTHMHPVSNAGHLGTPTGQDQGQTLDVSVRELQRRKLETLGCSVAKQVGTKRYRSE